MAASRAAYFLAIVIPVNIAVVCWITGLRPALVPSLAAVAAPLRGRRDRRGLPARS